MKCLVSGFCLQTWVPPNDSSATIDLCRYSISTCKMAAQNPADGNKKFQALFENFEREILEEKKAKWLAARQQIRSRELEQRERESSRTPRLSDREAKARDDRRTRRVSVRGDRRDRGDTRQNDRSGVRTERVWYKTFANGAEKYVVGNKQ